jgi:hypothetical protein
VTSVIQMAGMRPTTDSHHGLGRIVRGKQIGSMHSWNHVLSVRMFSAKACR